MCGLQATHSTSTHILFNCRWQWCTAVEWYAHGPHVPPPHIQFLELPEAVRIQNNMHMALLTIVCLYCTINVGTGPKC